MNDKQLATAIKMAQQLHEESYRKGPAGENFGEYEEGWEECFIKACKEMNLSDQVWYILYLANHWSNDLAWWADKVLTGKDINWEFLTDLDEEMGKETK